MIIKEQDNHVRVCGSNCKYTIGEGGYEITTSFRNVTLNQGRLTLWLNWKWCIISTSSCSQNWFSIFGILHSTFAESVFLFLWGFIWCVWERLILEWEMQNKNSQVAFRFVQHLQKACGLAEVFKCLQAFLESKLISNYNHSFSLGLIFTLGSIFLSHISSHRSDYNFIVKFQLLYCQIKIVLVISG